MKKILIIAKKELGSYFTSSMAYVILLLTISAFNFFFFLLIDQDREASLRDMFLLMEFMFIFIVPLLTMRTFAQEKQAGTLEFLMTSPVTNTEIVLGKYLGNLFFLSILIGLTLLYYAIIEFFSDTDTLAVIAGYSGIWLEAAFFSALGILASSWTRNQLISAISTYTILLFLYLAPALVKFTGKDTAPLFDFLCFSTHLKSLSSGLVLSSDIIYFVSAVIFCLAATRISIENRL